MKRSKAIILIVVLSLILAGYNSFAQTAEELLPKAIQLEEVKGELYEAIETYRLILDDYPDNREVCAEALLHLGMCYEKLGLNQARQTYRQVISKYPEQEDKIAMARERISRMDVYTAELLAKAEEHLKKGNELFKRWEYAKAIKEYENAVTCGPNTELALSARYYIGQSWYRAGKYNEALATFARLIEENPGSNIAPVAKLMVEQVQYAMVNMNNQMQVNINSNKSTIIDPETGITYKKIKSLTGESDIITHTNSLNLSPNGKYLLSENKVIPMDGTAPFDLIDYESTGVMVTRGTWSPDGTKAAFYSGDALCVIPVSPETGHARGPLRKLKMHNLRAEPNPNWSPDSKRIAYSEGDKADLCMINADGNNFKRITDNDIFELVGPWSPDGKTIALGLEDKYIGLYDIDKEQFSTLVETGKRNFPVWSPDGKWILDGYFREVYLFDLDSRNELKFYPPQEVGKFFSWSTDKKGIFFFRTSYNYNSRLRIASPDGGPSYEPVPLLADYWHEWRNDSKFIAVWGEDEKGGIAIRITPISGGRSDVIHIGKIPGGISQSYHDIDSRFNKILFSVEMENGETDLYVVPVSAEEARTTGPPVKFYDNYRGEGRSLSPDGEKLAFIYEGNIWIAYTNGDDPIRVTDFQEVIDEWDISWIPDGTSLLLSTPSGWRLLKNPGPKGEIIKLLDEGKEIECSRWNFALSPDNSMVAVLTDHQIKIIPINDTKAGKLLDINDLGLKGCLELCWSPDGNSLAFIGSKEVDDKVAYPAGKFCIYTVPMDGSPPVRVAPDDDNVKYFLSWSPDGKWLAFSPESIIKIRPESTIWEADFDEILEKLAK
jgi:Tol biopolymer transport system component/TolA-binding protein